MRSMVRRWSFQSAPLTDVRGDYLVDERQAARKAVSIRSPH